MFELVEMDASNWEQALAVEVRSDQAPLVASHQPVALEILAKCYIRPDGQAWTPYLALDRGRPVGVAAVVDRGDRVQLRHFAVDHRRQREGYGRRMIAALLETISATRPVCRSMIVATHPDNEPALALYESAGFGRTGAVVGIEPELSFDLARLREQSE